MTSVQPLKPSEVGAKKLQVLPPFVIEAFNQLIAEAYDDNSKSATVKQDDAVKRIVQLSAKGFNPDLIKVTTDTVFKNKWLDVEVIFREAGWKVSFDKPGYNESYDASFEFRAK